MEIKDKIIALLIDSDNVSREYFAILLDELSKYGRVTYRRLYGDFSKPNANGWKPALLEYSIEQVQQIAYTTGKNASDSSMIIDAMDILYKGKVDCFCLATSDSDFTGLAMRFRNDNIIVIGAGEKKTPDSFRKACDRFIPIDELLAAKDGSEKATVEIIEEINNIDLSEIDDKKLISKKIKTKGKSGVELKSAKLINLAKEILIDGVESDGWMHFSAFMNDIYRKENDFNPKLYGHRNSSASSYFKDLVDNTGKKAIFILESKSNVKRIKLNN